MTEALCGGGAHCPQTPPLHDHMQRSDLPEASVVYTRIIPAVDVGTASARGVCVCVRLSVRPSLSTERAADLPGTRVTSGW